MAWERENNRPRMASGPGKDRSIQSSESLEASVGPLSLRLAVRSP
jgi:hypothetical protein